MKCGTTPQQFQGVDELVIDNHSGTRSTRRPYTNVHNSDGPAYLYVLNEVTTHLRAVRAHSPSFPRRCSRLAWPPTLLLRGNCSFSFSMASCNALMFCLSFAAQPSMQMCLTDTLWPHHSPGHIVLHVQVKTAHFSMGISACGCFFLPRLRTSVVASAPSPQTGAARGQACRGSVALTAQTSWPLGGMCQRTRSTPRAPGSCWSTMPTTSMSYWRPSPLTERSRIY